MKPRFKFETKLLAALAGAVLMVTLLAATVWKMSQDSLDAVLQVSRAHETTDSIARARGDTLLLEVSTRAYVISGNAASLAEHDAALAALETSLRQIKTLTANDARQQARWMRLREATDARIATARRSVLQRATESFEAARAYNSGAEIRETRERVLRLLREMEEAEDQMLEERTATQLRARQIMATTGALAALGVIVLLLATYVLIRRQFSARARAEATLRESEESLATTLSSIGDAVLATDTEGRVTRMNPVAERLTGWLLAEAQGRPVDEVFRIVNEETRASAVGPVAKVLETGEIHGLANHTVLIARDGTEWSIADSAAPIRDAEGRVGGVVLVFRDVTVERRAEQAIHEQNELLEQRVRERMVQLRVSEERFRLLVGAVKDYAIIMLDPQGCVLTWNMGAQRLKGYADDEIIGQHSERFYPPEDVAAGKPARLLALAQADGRSEDQGWRLRKDGTRFFAAMVLTALRGEAGELVGFAKITRDLTERKQAEAQLQLQATALDAAANAIIITDRDSTILWVNRAFATLTGYSAEEVVGRNPRLLNAGVHDAEYYRRMHQVISAGKVWRGEIINRNKDGRLVTEDMTITPLCGDDGNVTHFIAIKQDITERKQTERRERDRGRIMESISVGVPLSATLELIALSVEADAPGALCSILLLDEAGKHLLLGAAPSLPEFYNQAIHGVEIGVGVGSCGTAAAARQRVIAADVQTHPYWVGFRELAQQANLSSCWSEPILSAEGQVLGTFAIYHREPCEPGGKDIERIQAAAALACSAIERKQAETKILQLNADLERRVAERTAQLQAANTELQAEMAERKRAEAQLQLQAAALDAAANAIIITDRDSTILWVNRAFITLTGYSPEEAIGQNPRLLKSGVHDAEFYRGMYQTLLADGVWQGEMVNRYKDGRLGTELMTITSLHGEDGEITHFIAVKQDITERKQSEATLERLRMDRQRVLDSVAEGLLGIDQNGNIVFENPAAAAMLGWDMHELTGQPAHALMHHTRADGSPHPQSECPIYATFRDGVGRRVEDDVFWRKDGSSFPVAYSSTPMRSETGELIGAVVAFRDITDRKRAEEKLLAQSEEIVRKNTELERANQAKSDFLANMSHELRTPLNAIIGFSEMLKDGVPGDLNAKQRHFVTDIFDAGTHLLLLINDILDLSKIEADMLELVPAPVDVAALLKSSLMVVREKALAHHIRLDARLDPALGAMLADQRKLKQIVYNLLSNAVKFSPEGGAVTLSARRCSRAEVAFDETWPARLIALPPGAEDEFLTITVEDSGEGIAEADLGKLFEPFTQVDSSVARRYGGTGLGLALARRLAELHGGTMGVASRPGAGSTFSVWLPWRAAVPASQEAPTTAVGTAPPVPTVPLALVIEDDDRMAELIAAQLRAEGFQVMRASTAEEGLVRAAKSRPQLITLDIFLPAMDGWEFMRCLKADPRLTHIPVVVITISDDLDRGLVLGARRVLQKPFVREDLVAALAGLVEARADGEAPGVLVVDDNAKAVELLAAALEAEGYRVLRAYGGAEAIEAARRALPDVVILDLMMPEVSGFDVARALRDSEQTARIPILVLTAKDLTAEDHARLNGDVSAILSKTSFSTSELLAELRRALPRRGAD